jgi:hypothetical protein
MSDDLDIESFSENEMVSLGLIPSEVLCEAIIAFRYLGLFKSRAVAHMRELSRRRELGDDFDFENFIKLELGKLPNFSSINTNFIGNLSIFGKK